MLQHLSIKNYALIDHLELDLSGGFSVITGETGAGKSIILGALSMILGRRADLKSVRNSDKKCVVEGTFKLDREIHLSFFEKNDLDFEEVSIIRREITPSGKSRAFINDTPARLEAIESLAERLIDVHSQHHNLLLNDLDFQLQLLDNFAQNTAEREAYTQVYQQLQGLNKELNSISKLTENESGDMDYLDFLFNELEAAQIRENEQEDIEEQLRLVESADEVQNALSEGIRMLDGEPFSVLQALQQASSNLSQVSQFDKSFGEWSERLESARIELDDLRASMEDRLQNLEVDPQEIQRLDQRLSLLMTLQQKHRVNSVGGLIERKKELQEKLENLSEAGDKLKELSQQKDKLQKELAESASRLHQSRVEVIPNLESKIQDLLKDLNLAHSTFQIRLSPTQNYHSNGSDRIDFLFTANRGSEAALLNKVASGGELSRVMLALKAILAQTQNLPSIIFDEIDTGVSGETAQKIGNILQGMGQVMQVMAISHLPQIASLGQHHFKVVKESDDENTFTRIVRLDDDERIDELARLLSGGTITEAARENARELRKQAVLS